MTAGSYPEKQSARETRATRARYDRLAALYDRLVGSDGRGSAGSQWRARLCAAASGRVLELGMGTGANLPYYPPRVELTGVDISPRMLSFARQRAERLGRPVNLVVADAQDLPFPDQTFDAVVSSFFLCTVPDPGAALAQAWRVLRPGGELLLLEHERSSRPLLGRLLDLVAPLAVRLVGDHPNRRTRLEAARAGFVILEEVPLWLDVVYFVRACRPRAPGVATGSPIRASCTG
ncbi:MAG: methyltransferase domain-containing protein [Bacillota bacterium]